MRPLPAIVWLVAIGCSTPAGAPPARGTATPTVEVAPAPSSLRGAGVEAERPSRPSELAALAMAPHLLEAARLRIDAFVDFELEETLWTTGGVWFQGLTENATGDSFEILVRAHPDETIAGFLRDHEHWRVEPARDTTVCGKPATALRATRDAEHITCVIREHGANGPAYLPATEVEALVFDHEGRGVIVSVRIVSDAPEKYRAIAQRILDSLACD